MKRNRSKLISAVAMLVISAIAVTSATYAWFTMSDTVKATGLELTAAVPADVQIALSDSTDDADWMHEVTLPVTDKKLRPASTATAFNESFFEVVNSNATTGANYIVTGEDGALVPSDFRKIPAVAAEKKFQYYYDTTLYFRTTGTYDIDLVLNDLLLKAVGDANPEPALTKALRVAFLSPDGTDYSYANAGDPMPKLIFASTATAYNAASGAQSLLAVTPRITTDGDVIIRIPANDEANVNTPGATVAVKVRIYLEGQDTNCKNANVDDALNVNLTFFGTEVVPGPYVG